MAPAVAPLSRRLASMMRPAHTPHAGLCGCCARTQGSIEAGERNPHLQSRGLRGTIGGGALLLDKFAQRLQQLERLVTPSAEASPRQSVPFKPVTKRTDRSAPRGSKLPSAVAPSTPQPLTPPAGATSLDDTQLPEPVPLPEPSRAGGQPISAKKPSWARRLAGRGRSPRSKSPRSKSPRNREAEHDA